MPLHLVFANRVEPLVDSLSAALEAHWKDLAHPPEVVVPSPPVAKWLKLRLCERRPALMGLPTPTLEGFLWRSLKPDPGMTMLRGPALSQVLVPLLDQACLEDERYGRVREFLTTDGALNPRRRMQLCQELARLFLEYEYNRPSVWKDGEWAVGGMDRCWPGRPYFAQPGQDECETEAWQRDLYGKVFAADGVLARRQILSLPALHRLRREGGWGPEGPVAMVFLVDKVSHFHRNLLMELSQGRELHLFLQNPCAEFWEDVECRRHPKTRRNVAFPAFEADDYAAEVLSPQVYPAGADGSLQDPLLLSRWGGTARENISLWSQVTEYEFDFLVEPPLQAGEESTVLSLLQHSLLSRHPGPGAQPLDLEDGQILSNAIAGDDSLQILACPERGREMEAVRDAVFQWLSEDPARSPSDCLVLLADPARHRTEVHRVFGGSSPVDPAWIPWAFLGEPGRESRFARGVEALLALVQHGMDRARVFELLRNPLCQARLGVEAQAVGSWERWAEGSGMIRGWDAQDREATGDLLGWDTHTFQAGILRMYAARLADGELGLGLRAACDQVRLPGWRDFESSDPVALEAFVAALERLQQDLKALRNGLPTVQVAALSKRFVTLCEAWLETGASEESQVRRQWREAMELLALQEGRTEAMDLEELVDCVRTFLPEEIPGSARAFAGSLTFAPLRISSLVPHELIVVVGLESDAFPRVAQRTSLDLLGRKRLVGDADPSQDDRHAMLSVILSARSRLVLSWKAEDLQKDRELEASSVLMELRSALTTVTSGNCLRAVRLLAREPGLGRKGMEPWPVESWDPEDAVKPQEAAGSEAWERLVPSAGRTEEGPVRVGLAQVRSFLQNPWLRHLRSVLGLAEEDLPDTLGSAQEPLESDALSLSLLRRRIFLQMVQDLWLEGNCDPAARAACEVERFAWESRSPEGELLVQERQQLVRWAQGLHEVLTSRVKPAIPGRLVVQGDLSLGTSGISPVVALSLEAGETVELTGSVPLALVGEGVTLLVLSRIKAGSKGECTPDPTQRMEAWLAAAALQAAGHRDISIAYLSRDLPRNMADAGAWLVQEPVQEDLGAWLCGAVSDLRSGRCEFLPARPLIGGIATLAQLREDIEGSEWPEELERLFRPQLPGEASLDDSVLQALTARRLGPLVDVTTEATDE